MLSTSVMARALRHETREAWIESRRRFIGGSDAPALFGVSRFASPYSLWAAKKRGVDVPHSGEWLDWGNYLEGAIARAYAERARRTVSDLGRYTILVHANRVTSATLDFVLGDDGRGPGVLQVKNASVGVAHAFRKQIPVDYEIQLQQEMLVSGCRWGVLAVLIGGNRLATFELDANEPFHQLLLETESDWWDQYVRGGDVPEIDGAPATTDTLRLVWRNVVTAKTIALPARFAALWRERARVVAEIANLETKVAAIENAFMQELGDAEHAVIPGVGLISRSARQDGTRVWKWPRAADPVGADDMLRTLSPDAGRVA